MVRYLLQLFAMLMALHTIDHLHVRTKEFINTLIVVTSRLDSVVTSMNVLNPMENRMCHIETYAVI